MLVQRHRYIRVHALVTGPGRVHVSATQGNLDPPMSIERQACLPTPDGFSAATVGLSWSHPCNGCRIRSRASHEAVHHNRQRDRVAVGIHHLKSRT